jgi:hypothetical protein
MQNAMRVVVRNGSHSFQPFFRIFKFRNAVSVASITSTNIYHTVLILYSRPGAQFDMLLV